MLYKHERHCLEQGADRTGSGSGKYCHLLLVVLNVRFFHLPKPHNALCCSIQYLTFALLMLYILLSPCTGHVNLQYVAIVLLILKLEHFVTKIVKFSTRQ